MRRFPILVLLLSTFLVPAFAADPLPEPPPPVKNYRAKPPATPPAESEQAVPEPEVVITTRGEDRYEEYRVGGVLYMIKVTPKVGKPYYLVDRQGTGVFDRTDFVQSVSPPMWVIKRF